MKREVRTHLLRRGRMALRRRVGILPVCALAACVLLIGARPSLAQSSVDMQREYNVKAVSLYGFGRYVTWPDETFAKASSPFVIVVLGEYPFGDALNRIAQKKTIHGRRIVVHRMALPKDLCSCHILFISKSLDEKTEAAAVEAMRGKHVLLVGETAGFARRGGMINFFIQGGSVRFELNVETTVREQLALNAKMHSLGVRVKSP